jgi:hypothetical protein
MAAWVLSLGGLVVWGVHFFGCYFIGSVWQTTFTAAVLTLGLTAVSLAANGWLLWRTAPAMRERGGGDADPFDHWLLVLGFFGAALSALSVLWQGLPALFV